MVKRGKLKQMFVWLKSCCVTELLKLTDNYLNQVYKKGGCFHIWGHSWEIEQYELWEKLELVFQRISNLPDFIYLSNQSLAVGND